MSQNGIPPQIFVKIKKIWPPPSHVTNSSTPHFHRATVYPPSATGPLWCSPKSKSASATRSNSWWSRTEIQADWNMLIRNSNPIIHEFQWCHMIGIITAELANLIPLSPPSPYLLLFNQLHVHLVNLRNLQHLDCWRSMFSSPIQQSHTKMLKKVLGKRGRRMEIGSNITYAIINMYKVGGLRLCMLLWWGREVCLLSQLLYNTWDYISRMGYTWSFPTCYCPGKSVSNTLRNNGGWSMGFVGV